MHQGLKEVLLYIICTSTKLMLVDASDYKKIKCGFCAKTHKMFKCPMALIKTPDEIF